MGVLENDRWKTAVATMLMQGYGVEDIAVKLESSVPDVRLEVKILREEGVFARWYG